MCPEGAPQSGAPYRIEIIRASPLLAPLSGRIFAWRVPWAKPFSPFGAQTLYPSLKLACMWRPPDRTGELVWLATRQIKALLPIRWSSLRP